MVFKTVDTQKTDRARAAALFLQACAIDILLALRSPNLLPQPETARELSRAARAEAHSLNASLEVRLGPMEFRQLQHTALNVASARLHGHHRQAEALQRYALRQLSFISRPEPLVVNRELSRASQSC